MVMQIIASAAFPLSDNLASYLHGVLRAGAALRPERGVAVGFRRLRA
jgi:hypothetical protein